jgi:hypothetical protein
MLSALAVIARVPTLLRLVMSLVVKLNGSTRGLKEERRRDAIAQSLQVSPAASALTGKVVKSERITPGEPVRRVFFALGKDDPEASPELVAEAERQLGLRDDRVRWLASGAHHPHIESARDPEGTLRNRYELTRLIDEALDEVSPSRARSFDFADTELAPSSSPTSSDGRPAHAPVASA